MTSEGSLRGAAFGAGCFWHVEAAFGQVRGVVETEVGFMGGHSRNPSYAEVCAGGTGHAEVVHIRYDPSIVSYEQLLDLFWEIHDPTTLNRQGMDVGEQYRSVIFFYDDQQKRIADASKEMLQKSGKHRKMIVTQVLPASEFYRAEEYHQKYFEKKGELSCRVC